MKFVSPQIEQEKTFTLKLCEGHAQALATIMNCVVNHQLNCPEWICEYEEQFAADLLGDLKNFDLLI